ncbi:DUF4262 domain-containing protein [Arthrobacter sp. JSM 101049]|uniref:DUF4262 domain-containing protein n=1 Tax=Arthrobacter sp. JSM 101049 TaxID=929097 RepID=UPI003568BAA2
MCTNCSTLARRLEPAAAPPPGDWFVEHAIGRRGVPVAYTVGLTGLDQPELIIREVAYGVAHGILHALVDRLAECPARLQPGTATGPGGRELILRRYAHSIELTQAIVRYEGIIGVLQVVPAPAAPPKALRPGGVLELARGKVGA